MQMCIILQRGGNRRKIYPILIILDPFKRSRSPKCYVFGLKWTLRICWWHQNHDLSRSLSLIISLFTSPCTPPTNPNLTPSTLLTAQVQANEPPCPQILFIIIITIFRSVFGVSVSGRYLYGTYIHSKNGGVVAAHASG